MDKIKVFALMGKSASGKDTIMREVLEYTSCFNEIISHTTRPKRENEIEGKNYFFISQEEFIKLIEEDSIFEFTEFNGWLYGTADTAYSKDKPNIGVFSPSGIAALSENPHIDLTVFYIQASDRNRLMRQLLRETNPDVHEIIRRFKTDEEDFKDYNLDFNCNVYRLDNNTTEDFNTAVGTIISFL